MQRNPKSDLSKPGLETSRFERRNDNKTWSLVRTFRTFRRDEHALFLIQPGRGSSHVHPSIRKDARFSSMVSEKGSGTGTAPEKGIRFPTRSSEMFAIGARDPPSVRLGLVFRRLPFSVRHESVLRVRCRRGKSSDRSPSRADSRNRWPGTPCHVFPHDPRRGRERFACSKVFWSDIDSFESDDDSFPAFFPSSFVRLPAPFDGKEGNQSTCAWVRKTTIARESLPVLERIGSTRRASVLRKREREDPDPVRFPPSPDPFRFGSPLGMRRLTFIRTIVVSSQKEG